MLCTLGCSIREGRPARVTEPGVGGLLAPTPTLFIAATSKKYSVTGTRFVTTVLNPGPSVRSTSSKASLNFLRALTIYPRMSAPFDGGATHCRCIEVDVVFETKGAYNTCEGTAGAAGITSAQQRTYCSDNKGAHKSCRFANLEPPSVRPDVELALPQLVALHTRNSSSNLQPVPFATSACNSVAVHTRAPTNLQLLDACR